MTSHALALAAHVYARKWVIQLLVAELALHVALVQTANAQTSEILRRIEVGGTLGLAFVGTAGAQTVNQCNRPTKGTIPVLGLRGAYRLKRWLVLDATLEVDSPIRENVACPPPPPARSGPDTLIADFPSREYGGFPKVTITTARIGVIPWATAWAEIRFYGGLGRIWHLHVFPVIAGLNGRVKFGSIHITAEVEAARYPVAFTHATFIFQDGSLGSTQETMSYKQRLDVTVRLGIGLPL